MVKFKTEEDRLEAEKTEEKRSSIFTKEDLDPKNTKVMVSLRLDSDLLTTLKKEATKSGIGYQTFINSYLRKKFLDKEEQKISDIIQRLEKLEKDRSA